jgi:outer membrane protein OmpA-like peptidoglycan-associated protein
VLLEKDRRDLEAASRENQQLRYTRDSLYTTMVNDTIRRQQLNQQDSVFKALDDKTLRYMQQQANLNDSIRQRLTVYETELTRLQPPVTSTAVAELLPISRFDTNVFFRINSYEVPSQSFNELLAFANFLKANPNLKLQLTGYTDQTGKPDYNQVLSRKRVEVLGAFFQEQGIEKERLFMQYFGAVKSEGRLPSLNRKVVLKTIN